jgi:hypothetical protein
MMRIKNKYDFQQGLSLGFVPLVVEWQYLEKKVFGTYCVIVAICITDITVRGPASARNLKVKSWGCVVRSVLNTVKDTTSVKV